MVYEIVQTTLIALSLVAVAVHTIILWYIFFLVSKIDPTILKLVENKTKGSTIISPMTAKEARRKKQYEEQPQAVKDLLDKQHGR